MTYKTTAYSDLDYHLAMVISKQSDNLESIGYMFGR